MPYHTSWWHGYSRIVRTTLHQIQLFLTIMMWGQGAGFITGKLSSNSNTLIIVSRFMLAKCCSIHVFLIWNFNNVFLHLYLDIKWNTCRISPLRVIFRCEFFYCLYLVGLKRVLISINLSYMLICISALSGQLWIGSLIRDSNSIS